ncbi:MAG TPA: Minf_1886 family protein [Longimicrobiales bacterium]|nr:Minf_1886 family protein [Longimicrobiales bacterium]
MDGVVLDESVLERLRGRYPRFHDMTYLFVLSALHHVLQQLPEPRHISGAELAGGVRDLALEKFGPMARTVLEHWGIHETGDVGDVVFALVEVGILIKQEEDTRADFEGVYEFDEAFRSPFVRRREA